ncbi:MAG: hypothetical protein ACRDH5_01825, partial [bacterium]
MRKSIVAAALLALAGALPVTAERLYVPMVGAAGADGQALPTEIWVTRGEAATPVRATFLRGEAAEAKSFVVAPGGRLLDRLAAAGEVGLVAIEAEENAVSAWIPDAWGTSVSEVPVIGPHDLYVPGATPGMQLGAYEKLMVGAANLDAEAASCEAVLFDSAYAELGRFAFAVPAESLVRQDAAATIGREKATYAEVGCNRRFYPIGVTTSGAGGNTRVAVAKGIGPNGACDLPLLTVIENDPKNYRVTGPPGLFHHATKGDPKGILCVKSTKQLAVATATFQWDVKVGPWAKQKSNLHNLAY